ncbi:sensor histidine kinase [Agrococcus sp. DT81.2]|uniref:sensor histidine kinase n=1 Tax=Agrococcus sp. DT81.2 TaxID=3393414 RepID=UPI003CE58BE2
MPEPAARSAVESSAGGVAAPVRWSPTPHHEFLAGLTEEVNHHLRTALTPVLGHAELLIEQQHRIPTDLHPSLTAVMRAGRRLNDVVLGICELLRMACVDPSAVETINVWELLSDELATHRARAARQLVRLAIGGDPVEAHGVDAERLGRAVRELLDNALRFSPERSTVRVTTTAAAEWIRITVSDDGDGIDPADHERLVRPFERGCDPRQPRPGLGLALASAVAASHGGRLVLSESSSGGLEVTLELPGGVRPPARAAGPPDA